LVGNSSFAATTNPLVQAASAFATEAEQLASTVSTTRNWGYEATVTNLACLGHKAAQATKTHAHLITALQQELAVVRTGSSADIAALSKKIAQLEMSYWDRIKAIDLGIQSRFVSVYNYVVSTRVVTNATDNFLVTFVKENPKKSIAFAVALAAVGGAVYYLRSGVSEDTISTSTDTTSSASVVTTENENTTPSAPSETNLLVAATIDNIVTEAAVEGAIDSATPVNEPVIPTESN